MYSVTSIICVKDRPSASLIPTVSATPHMHMTPIAPMTPLCAQKNLLFLWTDNRGDIALQDLRRAFDETNRNTEDIPEEHKLAIHMSPSDGPSVIRFQGVCGFSGS